MTDDDERAKRKAELLAVYAANGGKLVVGVSKCTECPYFGTSILTIIAFGSRGGDTKPGNCYAPIPKLGGGVLLRKSLPVEDGAQLPTWCPLKLGDVVVTLGD